MALKFRLKIAQHLMIGGLLAFGSAMSYAAEWLDTLRAYDLNDYALGLALGSSQSPYIDTDPSIYVYPYLTGFQDDAFTDSWLVLNDGDLGVRWVSANDWYFGAIGRINTLGLVSGESIALQGVKDREWTIELGPTIGFRGWPIHLNAKAYTEILGLHSGFHGFFELSWPRKFASGFIVPSVGYEYQHSDYADYYFGISTVEATPARPVYKPGASLNRQLKIDGGYRLSELWLLKANVSYTWLDNRIRNSPLVDEDALWSATLGIAYNSDIFQTRKSVDRGMGSPTFELRIGGFWDFIDTVVEVNSTVGTPGSKFDMEDILGIAEDKVVPRIDTIFRLSEHHRLELNFFKIVRNSSITSERDLSIGDITINQGTVVKTDFSSQSWTVAYGYSLLKDPQKELGVNFGIHYTKFEIDLATGDGQRQKVKVETPLPVMGMFGALPLSQDWALDARIHFFALDFDRFDGFMTNASVDLSRKFTSQLSGSLGYSLHFANLESDSEQFSGKIKVLHHGPTVSLLLKL